MRPYTHRLSPGGMTVVMSWIFAGMIGVSLVCAAVTGNGSALAGSVAQGAQKGMEVSLSIAGALCLWSGVGKLMEHAGMTDALSRLLRPFLGRLFPSAKRDPILSGALSANICANILGLGNAATPMGIRAAQRLAASSPGVAGDELCRLIVLNTASIQLIPATVAALRSAAGCVTPFDVLPAVWVTSICSAGAGLISAWFLGRLWKR